VTELHGETRWRREVKRSETFISCSQGEDCPKGGGGKSSDIDTLGHRCFKKKKKEDYLDGRLLYLKFLIHIVATGAGLFHANC